MRICRNISRHSTMKAYDMNSDDYKVVWGDKVSVSYISPSTLNKIPAALKEGVAKPADGEMRMVNYAYSETEPSLVVEKVNRK